jgi:hypothetical protein
MGRGEELGRPHQNFEADNHRGEQTGGESSQKSREYGSGGEQEKNGGRYRPEPLSGWNPLGNKAGRARNIKEVLQCEGNHTDPIEAADLSRSAPPMPNRAELTIRKQPAPRSPRRTPRRNYPIHRRLEESRVSEAPTTRQRWNRGSPASSRQPERFGAIESRRRRKARRQRRSMRAPRDGERFPGRVANWLRSRSTLSR